MKIYVYENLFLFYQSVFGRNRVTYNWDKILLPEFGPQSGICDIIIYYVLK